MEEVFDQHRLTDSVRSDEDDVGGVVDEGEREELLDEELVDAFGQAIVRCLVPVDKTHESASGCRYPTSSILKAPMRALVRRRSRERRLRSRSSMSMTRSTQGSGA